jgi:outer membrane protein assembly factor BamB
VYISYTGVSYHGGRLLVPQAGRSGGRLRCLDAATGDLQWEAPISGSPSWSRQLAPIVHENVAIYMFGTGRYDDDVPDDEKVKWLWSHGNVTSYPVSHQPMLRAYNLESGEEVWTRDFSEYGAGGDESGICLLDDVLYYSCFFGSEARRGNSPGPYGVTAALDPPTGRIRWLTTKYSVHSGCSISAAEGRVYVGGYCRDPETRRPHVWCLDADDGSLVWRSEPLPSSIQVVTIALDFLFVHSHGSRSYLLDKRSGKILTTLNQGYKCSRFTLSGNYLLGPNLDVVDLSDPRAIRLLSTGPRLDPSECIGGIASNGRVFYTCHAGGLQASLISASEAAPDAFRE